MGKGGRPKKATTIVTDTGRIDRHIIPLIGTRRVKDLVKADINKVLKDIMAGKTRVSVKTKKLRGKAIVRGGAGTATRTVGLLGGILTYAVEAGIIATNPAHGLRKPKDNVRNRRLTEAEYRTLGEMLRDSREGREIRDDGRDHSPDRSDRLPPQRDDRPDVDRGGYRGKLSAPGRQQGGQPRFGRSACPWSSFWKRVGRQRLGTYVFPGYGDDNAFGSFPNHWEQIFRRSPLSDVTPHVLRHSFASIAQRSRLHRGDDRRTGRPCQRGRLPASTSTRSTPPSSWRRTRSSGYIQGLLDGKEFKQTAYALDRDSRKAALARFLRKAAGDEKEPGVEDERLAA